MKRNLTILILLLFVCNAFAQTNDYILKKEYQSEKRKTTESIVVLKKQVAKQRASLDGLDSLVSTYKILVKANTDSLNSLTTKINTIQTDQFSDISKLSTSRLFFLTLIVLVFLLVCILFFWIKRNTERMFAEAAEKNKEVHDRFIKEIAELKQAELIHQESVAKTTGELSSRISATIFEFSQKTIHFSEELKSEADKSGKSLMTLQHLVNSLSADLEASKQTLWDELKKFKEGHASTSSDAAQKIKSLDNQVAILSQDLKALKGK